MLYLVLFEIFIVEKYRDLEIPVKGQSMSLKWYNSIDCVLFPISVPKTHRFWDIRLQKCRNLEHLVMDTSGSWDFLLTFYDNYRSILCPSEIFNVEKDHNLEVPVKGQSRSLKVVPFEIHTYMHTLYWCVTAEGWITYITVDTSMHRKTTCHSYLSYR